MNRKIRGKLFIMLSCLVIGSQVWATRLSVPNEEDEQEQMYQYLKVLIDEMEDPMLNKSKGRVFKRGGDPMQYGDLAYYYTFPNGKYEPVRYMERNADGSPKAYSWWDGGAQLYEWMLNYYTWGIFPFVISETAQRDTHGVKGRPQGRITVSVTADRIIFKTYYDFQIPPEPGDGRYDSPTVLNIGDPFKKHLGCRQGGTKTYTANISLKSQGVNHVISGKCVCNKHYIRFIDIGLNQTRQADGRYKVSGLRGNEDLDFTLKNATYQSCWFVAHWETITFMLSDVAKACGMTCQELDDAILNGGFKSFWLAGSATPINYMMAKRIIKQRGINLKDLERQHQQYQQQVAEQKRIQEERLRRQKEIRQKRETFLRDSLAEETAYFKELFKAFPKIKKPYLTLKQKVEAKSEELSKALQAEMEPRITQLLIKYKGNDEDEGYKAEYVQLQGELSAKVSLMSKNIEATIESEKTKYEKASAKYKEKIKEFRENYKRNHPNFRRAME